MAFVSTFVAGGARLSAGAGQRCERTVTSGARSLPKAVIVLPNAPASSRVCEPFIVLSSYEEHQFVVNSSKNEYAVVMYLKKNDAASSTLRNLLTHHAHEFANLSCYVVEVASDDRGAAERYGVSRFPLMKVFSDGDAIYERQYRLTNARDLRTHLKTFADRSK